MTSEQWARVNDLFHHAIERSAGERHVWLAEAAGDDPEVRREVEALIAAHERQPDFLDDGLPPGMTGLDTDIGAASSGPLPPDASLPHSAGPSLAGRRIGPYAVTREIGRGGMGVVYLAHDTRLGRDVAIKALPQDLPADGRRRERLRREARAAAALAHPNIAIVYALEEEGDELFLVTEYVRGCTLRDEMTSGPLSAVRLLDTTIDIVRAMGAAHAQGIVHRDLKPDNVMRTPTGTIKVLDFGLARAIASWADDDLTPTLTRSGTLLGTPAYMAPEQIRGGRADGRSDLFAAGVMFYELATGVHPFEAPAIGLTLHRILTEAPLPFSARGIHTPPGFWAIVERCLQKEPDARYPGTDPLLADLLAVRGSLTSGLAIDAAGAIGMPPPAAAGTTPTATTAAATSTSTGQRTASGVMASGGREAPMAVPRETETGSRSSEWWWRFHQLAVSTFLAAVVVPAWRVWEWVPDELLRGVLRVGTLVVVALGASLRLHLWFLSRYDSEGLREQRPRSAPWVIGADGGLSLALLVGSLTIMPQHPGIGALFLGLSICYAVVFLMIEPATTRAAFRER